MASDHRSLDVQVESYRSAAARTRVTRVSTGATAERPFVLIAGIGVASTYFEFLAPLLAERGEVYALDLPDSPACRHPALSPPPPSSPIRSRA